MKKIAFALFCLILLSSCASSYQKAYYDDASLGDNKYSISFRGNNYTSDEILINYFEQRASELCALTGNYDVLKRNVEVLELDETPAFGMNAGVKLSITGIVECK